jgi:hypothetical protein
MSEPNGNRVFCRSVERISLKEVKLKSGRSSVHSKVLNPKSGRLLRLFNAIPNCGSNSDPGGAVEVVFNGNMRLGVQSQAATRWHQKVIQSLLSEQPGAGSAFVWLL